MRGALPCWILRERRPGLTGGARRLAGDAGWGASRIEARPQKASIEYKNSIGLGRDGGSRSPKRGVGATRFWGGG